MTAETTTALTLFALCLAPIVIVETTIAVTEAIRRRRERKEIYKPLKH
jgi:multidrug efflux pump subunit AcrB